MKQPKKIISEEMLSNMEMLAVTNPVMRDMLEQAKVIYTLNGSPKFYDGDDDDDGERIVEAMYREILEEANGS